MNAQGSAMVELLILLVVVALTSGVILFLVQTGVLQVRSSSAEYDSLLNAEFIPLAQEGRLAVQGFQCCSFVDENYRCLEEKKRFTAGERVYFRFAVETSTVSGDVLLVQNYRLKDAFGKVLLEVDEQSNNYARKSHVRETEVLYFKDFIVSEAGDEGAYTFELLIENPLLQKKATLIKNFELVGK